ncbi:MAG: TusE/DsrC/DsvC family sulfur relay protein [Candidatus Bathyarchaeota archaeon]|nr:MAG: TusE/DsrC/DsvC family sulfur relay protein [Candidatus Bathyarchaeota archaeon]
MAEQEHALDEEGFVKDPELWSHALAVKMAKEQFNISITELHRRVVEFVREYYLKWGAVPMVKTIRTHLQLSNRQLDEMFKRDTSSSRGVICKLAGLPKMLCIASGC